MKYIQDGGRQVEKKFAHVLKFCWEGLLYEYLRTVGCPLRDREHDPRHFVMRYWRRSMLDPSVQPGFVPFYAKREVRKEGGSAVLTFPQATEGRQRSSGFDFQGDDRSAMWRQP